MNNEHESAGRKTLTIIKCGYLSTFTFCRARVRPFARLINDQRALSLGPARPFLTCPRSLEETNLAFGGRYIGSPPPECCFLTRKPINSLVAVELCAQYDQTKLVAPSSSFSWWRHLVPRPLRVWVTQKLKARQLKAGGTSVSVWLPNSPAGVAPEIINGFRVLCFVLSCCLPGRRAALIPFRFRSGTEILAHQQKAAQLSSAGVCEQDPRAARARFIALHEWRFRFSSFQFRRPRASQLARLCALPMQRLPVVSVLWCRSQNARRPPLRYLERCSCCGVAPTGASHTEAAAFMSLVGPACSPPLRARDEKLISCVGRVACCCSRGPEASARLWRGGLASAE